MARSYRYLCKICNNRYDNSRIASKEVCEPDHADMVRTKRLYTTIVVKYPALKKASMAEVMERLWAWFLKHENDTAPEPIPPSDLTIDELKDIF